jgi:hypothetical protein
MLDGTNHFEAAMLELVFRNFSLLVDGLTGLVALIAVDPF